MFDNKNNNVLYKLNYQPMVYLYIFIYHPNQPIKSNNIHFLC